MRPADENNERPVRVLITGATGAAGPAVVRAFHERGYAVRTFSLDPPAKDMFPIDVEDIRGDITDPDAIDSALRGIDRVVHMAALLHHQDPPPSWKLLYEHVNVKGSANVVSASVRGAVKRLVFFSSSTVYGTGKGQVMTEESVPCPETIYAKTKLAAEELVLHANNSDGAALGTVLRMSAIYGPRIRGNYRRLATSLARRRFVPIGKGGNRRTLVYDQDAAAATVLAAMHPAAAGRIYNVTDGRIHTMMEILQTLAKALGRRAPKVYIPLSVARPAIRALEFGARAIGRPSPVSSEALSKYVEDCPVSSERITAELGFSPRFELDRGWSEVISALRRACEI